MSDLTDYLQRVRSGWLLVRVLRAWAMSVLTAGLAVVLALTVHILLRPGPVAGAWLWSVGVVTSLACLASFVRVLRGRPSDLQIARLVEERCPELEDALVTAVAEAGRAPTPLTGVVLTDALRRVRSLPLDRVIPSRTVGRLSIVALAATLCLLVASGMAMPPAVRGLRLAGFYLMPGHFGLVVSPGDARVPAGQPFEVRAQLPAVAEGTVPLITIVDGVRRREVAMPPRGGDFVLPIAEVDRDFRYTVVAAGMTSPEYTVIALYPPRVERVDLHYEYPASARMEPRDELNGGDMYGPAGTRVHVSIQADKAVVAGQLMLPEEGTVLLTAKGNRLEGELTITSDASYRIAMSDADGLKGGGDVEYFIRTLEDRPPDVRVIQPASDRRATPLEEVTIEARADDDFGVVTFDLVYSVRGQAERVVPFAMSGAGLSVSGKQTIYLEDLDVHPGDFVTYYARATDVSRGKRSTEARSEMFFLEVAPFDAEFVVSEEQGGGGGGDQAITDMIVAQKRIVTSTWTLDRRIRETGGRPDADIKAIAKAQADLRRRTLSAAAQAQRAADVRRRRGGVRPPAGPVPLEESDDRVGRAADAMLSAERQLEVFKTSPAIPFEMTALNELMLAEADVRRREVQRQGTPGNAGGENRQQQDLSSLFDKELAREQQTSIEMSNGGEASKGSGASSPALDKVRELARRQEALNRGQGTGASAGGSDEERRRQLERLTREQLDLKRQADDLARELGRQESEASGRGRGNAGGTSPPVGRGGGGVGERQRAVEQVAQDMQAAANELREQGRGNGSPQAARALARLRELEQQLGASASQVRPGAAAGDSEAAQRISEEVSRLRELRERLDALDQELGKASRAGSQGKGETGDAWKDARQLEQDVRGERALGLSPEGGGFNPGRSDPGTQTWKQDMARWDALKVQLQAALEKAEVSAVARLRGQRARDRLNAGASQSVPEAYRRLVERYYRALAGDRRP